LSFKYGWDAFHPTNPEQERMMADIGIGKSMVPYVGVLSLLTGVLLLIPQTFFVGNVLNAVTIVLIMALSLRAGVVRTALMEIPFLIIPLVLIWLKYPFKN